MNIECNNITIKEDILFNTFLSQDDRIVKLILKDYGYKISYKNPFYRIINSYVDVDEDGNYKYAGLIVRINETLYVSIYPKGCLVDEEEMLRIISNFISDEGFSNPTNVSVNKIEITKKILSTIIKRIK